MFPARDIRKGRPGLLLALSCALTLQAGCFSQSISNLSGVGASDPGSLSALWAPGETTDSTMMRAPELFQASGIAKWNGQRTARGVWVAHPKARGSQRVRIVNPRNGIELDLTLYRSNHDNGDIITVSSDAAQALGMRPGQSESLALYGLRPRGAISQAERRSAETSAQSELAVHISRLEDNQLLQVVAASMRGMGYATVFEPGPGGDSLSSIHAFPRPDAGFQLPAIRVVVHPTGQPRMTAEDIAKVQTWLQGSGDLGVLVSVSGFADSAAQGLQPDKTHLEMVDLDGLMNIWLTHYERLSDPDRALLPLRPVYFLAGQ